MSLNNYAIMPLADYQDACDAVRTKGGSTSQAIKSGELAAAIEAISGGGEGYPAPLGLSYLVKPVDESGYFDIAASDWPSEVGQSSQYGQYGLREWGLAGWNYVRDVTFPDTIRTIPAYFFAMCQGLRSVTAHNLREIGQGAFRQKVGSSGPSTSSLTTVDFSGCTFTDIPYDCFYGRTSLTTVTLPATCKTIRSYGFYQCAALTSLVESGLTEVQVQAFYGCTGLTDVPATLVNIGNSAFYGCTGLTSVDTAAGGTFGGAAFSHCTNLTTAKLRAKTTDTQTFESCTNLAHVWISADVATMKANHYATGPFANCTALTDIYCEATEKPSGWGGYYNYIKSNTQATVHWGVSEADFDALSA